MWSDEDIYPHCISAMSVTAEEALRILNSESMRFVLVLRSSKVSCLLMWVFFCSDIRVKHARLLPFARTMTVLLRSPVDLT